uniref:Ovule protein n=1 Tax=Ascaris lumbricoides TaxID=6252 RepID=A0A0M3HLP1_ASCLU
MRLQIYNIQFVKHRHVECESNLRCGDIGVHLTCFTLRTIFPLCFRFINSVRWVEVCDVGESCSIDSAWPIVFFTHSIY